MSRQSGKEHEQQAADYLRQQGLKLLTQNFHAYRGELDLVMLDRKTLVFVEVRFRKNSAYGSAAETVTYKKQQRLVMAAQHYLQTNRQHCHLPCRFDVIAINSTKIDWIKNAFLIT